SSIFTVLLLRFTENTTNSTQSSSSLQKKIIKKTQSQTLDHTTETLLLLLCSSVSLSYFLTLSVKVCNFSSQLLAIFFSVGKHGIGHLTLHHANTTDFFVSSFRQISQIYFPGHKELEMSVTETPKKTGAPQIVKLDKALKLAELWVNNMSKDADDDRTNADVEGRPSRLGLGAKVSRQSKFVPSDDPVERKLYAKLNAEKRKAANIAKESATIARDALDDDEDNEDLDSRANAFTKRKATAPLISSMLRNKKQK
ncbi:hypothetical protein D0Y65_049444, partial [Glycine soja]